MAIYGYSGSDNGPTKIVDSVEQAAEDITDAVDSAKSGAADAAETADYNASSQEELLVMLLKEIRLLNAMMAEMTGYELHVDELACETK